ncbi:MAG: hypothetical protein IJS96_03745 [Schwartzia sp.]|nr:hypothetical protein [Schwartzia sp. (in: firmicutes)]
MGLFGVAKVVKGIVKGGVKTYQADEALDKLMNRAEKEFGDALTPEEKALGERYRDWKRKFSRSELASKVTDAKLAYMDALAANEALPEDLRDEIRRAVNGYKRAENFALDTLEEVVAAEAKPGGQRDTVRKIIDEQKRK